MKAINLIIVFFVCISYFTIKAEDSNSNWILKIKNEIGKDEPIELRPGILTKVILSIVHEEFNDFWDNSLRDKVIFTITSKENDIKLYPNEQFSLIPTKSLFYITYIGLSCNHAIKDTEYLLDFEVKETKDLDGNEIEGVNLYVNPVKIKIKNIVTIIDIDPIETNLIARGFSLFKIANEIYNIEKIIIKPENYNKEKFKIEDIEIKPFLNRKIFSEEENDNHGILFDYKFGSIYEYQALQGELNQTFNLKIDYSGEKTCFDLSQKSKTVNFIINNNNWLILNDSIKETILSSMENVTPKRNIINNIQIKMNIPATPVLIECYLEGKGKGEKTDLIEYKDYILNSGQYIIKFNNLNSNNKYKGICDFSSTYFSKGGFQITMENEKEKDFITLLFPSRSSYGLPQCIEIEFTSQYLEKIEEQIKIFQEVTKFLCDKVMNGNDDIIANIMEKFICEKPEMKNDDPHNKNKAILCIGRSPNYNDENISEEDIDKINTYFSEKLKEFIDFFDTDEEILFMLYYHIKEIDGLQIVDIKRYNDSNPPDLNKIKVEIVKEDDLSKEDKINFKITSSNNQPIECFYNEEMKVDDEKIFLNLYHSEEGTKSIVLYPDEEKSFETYLKDYKEKKVYSLYMNCYNLPGARIRYQQTGIFNAYTIYTGIKEEQSYCEKLNVTVNCVGKKNKANPYCIKGLYNNLDEMLKTKMPYTDENEELEKFNKLPFSIKMDYLDEKFNNFDEEIGKIKDFSKIISYLINKEKMLANRDCYFYVVGSNNNSLDETNNTDYKNCRENKKFKHKKIIEYLKKNFDCQKLSFLISKNGISINIENNIKYIILLIKEVTDNIDSFTKGDNEVVLNMITCIQENYENYWNEVKYNLEEKGTSNKYISEVKEDISNLLINSMANLIKILHFNEIDNYISEDEKNMTSNGLMAFKKGKQIYKNMKQFIKNFNEFGDGLYNLSDSLIINVTINNDYKNKKSQEGNVLDEKAIRFEDEGIILLLNPQSILKAFNAYAMLIMNFDSPLIPVKMDDNMNEMILNTFISITLYDKKGNEIKIDTIPEDIRPKILYDKELYKFMNNCYFYDEDIEDLSEKGVVNNDNYIYEGNEYLKCTAEHLTCFTAGNYFSPITKKSNNSDKTNKVPEMLALIILGSILAVIIIVVIIIIIVKKKGEENFKDNMKNKNQELELGSIIN
jgi:hypothetical protein